MPSRPVDPRRVRALAQRVLARPLHVVVAAAAVGLACPAVVPGCALPIAAGALLLTLGVTASMRDRAGAPRALREALGQRGCELIVLAALVLAAGAAVGETRLDALGSHERRVTDGASVDARAHLLAHPRPGPLGASAEVRVTSGRLRGATLLARLPRWAGSLDAVPIGAELRVLGRLRSLDRIAADDRGRDFQVAPWLRRRRVAAELLAASVRPTGGRRGGLAGILDGVRVRAERAVAAGLPDDRAALLLGMALGQDEAIDDVVRDEFRASGLAHVLAVSGQNVMLLAALALPALAAAGLGAGGRGLALLALIALYVPLAGAGPSLQRAGIMGAAVIVATLAARPSSRVYALLLAAAATLALNPRSIGDPGWQLSFAAVAGIVALGRPLAATFRDAIRAARVPDGAEAPSGSTRSCERLPDVIRAPRVADGAEARPGRSGSAEGSPDVVSAGSGRATIGDRGPLADGGADGATGRAVRHFAVAGLAGRCIALGRRRGRSAALALADGVAITVAATLATAPLLAHHFGTVSLASLPANVLALPVVAPVMWLGMLKAAVGQLPLAGLPAGPAAGALGAVASIPLGVLATLAERCADLPAAQVVLPLNGLGAVAAGYALLAVAAVAARRAAAGLVGRAGTVGAGWRGLGPVARTAIVAGLGAAALLATAEGLAPPRPPEALTIRFLDVGQGDATLIQHPDGTAILFDGGPPEAGVARLLRRAGVSRLALLVATHASRDHHGGLLAVLRTFPVDLLLDGGDGTPDPAFRAVVAEAARREIPRVPAVAPLHLRVGALQVEVLSPPPRPPGPAPADPNPRAATAVVSSDDFDVLLSADAESPTLSALPLPDVELMKLPHHGSADPGLPDLLGRLRPEAAAITVGTNTYGHPAPSTLSALRDAHVPVWRTDRDGTVTITVAGTKMHVETES